MAERRKIQFSLACVFILTGLFAAWLGIQVNRANRQRLAVDLITRAGGFVSYDYEGTSSERIQARMNRRGGTAPLVPSAPPAPLWMRRLFGDDYFRTVIEIYVDYTAAEPLILDMAVLENLPALKTLNLSGCPITDDDLVPVGKLRHLKVLCLDRTDVTDEGLVHLKSLANLASLTLDRLPISDDGITHLRPLNRLEQLQLNGTQVTDAGLAILAKMPRLTAVYVEGTDVTDAGVTELLTKNNLDHLDLLGTRVSKSGVEEFRRIRPNCRIRAPHPDSWLEVAR